MALSQSARQLARKGLQSNLIRPSVAFTSQHGQKSHMATVAPPVTQNNVSAKGPTAMVFLNMGGPSTTGEVGSFLSRLFVRYTIAGKYIVY
jgi:ferrochelatase